MMKAFKYRLYPTRKQADIIQLTLDRNRELYNAALEERREAWHMSRVSVTYEMQSAQLPAIKEDRPEYNEVYAQVLQDTLKRVDKAFKAFFRRVKKGETPGYPRFQGYHRYDSFTYPQVERLKGKALVRIEDGRVVLPKIGHVKVKQHRPMIGKVKTCTIKREGDCWYIVVHRFGACLIAPEEQEVESKNLLGQLTYLERKLKGESSMSVTRLNAKGCSVTHRKSCTHGETWIG